MKKSRHIALSLHDLRVSGGAAAVMTIKRVMADFHAPLTLHLVCDEPLARDNPLRAFLAEKTGQGSMEVVFHGVTHKAAKKVKRHLAVYHKYEAEYIVDAPEIISATESAYAALGAVLGEAPGICPSCWLATKGNRELFAKLNAPYVESLFHLRGRAGSFFSPILSLASPYKKDLLMLKLFARIMYRLSFALKVSRVRVAVHPCDLEIPGSTGFLKGLHRTLVARGFAPVLQKDLAV